MQHRIFEAPGLPARLSCAYQKAPAAYSASVRMDIRGTYHLMDTLVLVDEGIHKKNPFCMLEEEGRGVEQPQIMDARHRGSILVGSLEI
jgi:hypothetical protein